MSRAWSDQVTSCADCVAAGILQVPPAPATDTPTMILRRVLALFAVASGAALAQPSPMNLIWSSLPSLPPSLGQPTQPGVASPFVGVHGDALIVAGGANFPERAPWDGGAKIWWDDIWVLERRADGAPAWIADRSVRLPRRLGYGVSVSTPLGVVCAGGHDAERAYADVFMLSWNGQRRELRRTELPPMPQPLTFMAGALVGDMLYVAGGQHVMKGAEPTSVFWSLDLSKRSKPDQLKWTSLPTWPGPPRVLAAAAGQRTGTGGEFFLFGGRVPRTGQATEILADAYAFNVRTRTWRTLPKVGGGAGVSVMAAAAIEAGNNEIFVFGGDRGELFLELESHDLAIEAARRELAGASAAARAELEKQITERLQLKRRIYETHPGFSRDVLAYDTRRDSWRMVGQSPKPLPVTTTAVRWGDAILLPSGEIRPGVRSDDILSVKPAAR